MFRVSNNLVGILNFITFLLSIPILCVGLWLTRQGTTECERFLEKPIIGIGVFLLVVSLSGLIGACCRVTWLLWVYLLVMFLLIVVLFCFTVFAFVVTNKGAGESLSGKGYKEYRLGDYSNWLRKRVDNAENWNKIVSCLRGGRVCQSLIDDDRSSTNSDQFFHKHLSSVQSGCCKPSNDCKLEYVGSTIWNTTATSTMGANSDCRLWDNAPQHLCYRCQSCKAGLLDNLKHSWKKVAVVNIIFLVFLIIVYSIGCCAFRNNRKDGSYTHHSGF